MATTTTSTTTTTTEILTTLKPPTSSESEDVALTEKAGINPSAGNDGNDSSDDGAGTLTRQGHFRNGLSRRSLGGPRNARRKSDGTTNSLRKSRSKSPGAETSTIVKRSARIRKSITNLTEDSISTFWKNSDHSNVQKKKEEHSVRFCEENNIVYDWENLTENHVNELWYTQRELNQITKDNKKNIKLKHFHSRGLEDLANNREGEAEKNRQKYVREVIKAYNENKPNNKTSNSDENSNIDEEHLRMVSNVSFTNSKAARKEAWKKAKEDETDAYYIYKKEKRAGGGGTKFRRTASMPERAEHFVKRMNEKLPAKMAEAASNLMTTAAQACK